MYGSVCLTGWSDCCIRAYFPESGRLMYMVNKAYGSSVTAVAAYNSCQYIISGSDLGHVAVWKVPARRKTNDINQAYKHFLLKEHKATVTGIKIKKDDSNCVTSSIDGSCIIWDLKSVFPVLLYKYCWRVFVFCKPDSVHILSHLINQSVSFFAGS
jgi:cilia- and flagella-associated protein 52